MVARQPTFVFVAMVVGLLLVITASILVVVWKKRKRITPEEREKRRRLYVNKAGRISDGLVIDIQDTTIHFEYSVNGVEYQASQDLAALLDRVDLKWHGIVGPVSLKYLPRNPANSIVVCETWSGLREPDDSIS
jgi:hypothetical protein